MVDFANVRLDENIERGSSGGPGFNTSVVQLANGHEKRNQEWDQARARWDVGYGIQNAAGYQSIVEFFSARRGRLQGFLFKDWSDFQVVNGFLATGDGSTTQLQLYKRYGDLTDGFYDRLLFKIVPGTISFTANGSDDTGNWSVNTDTGVATRGAGLVNSVEYRGTFEFYVPMRFDLDRITVSLEQVEAGAIPNIPIVELRQRSTL